MTHTQSFIYNKEHLLGSQYSVEDVLLMYVAVVDEMLSKGHPVSVETFVCFL